VSNVHYVVIIAYFHVKGNTLLQRNTANVEVSITHWVHVRSYTVETYWSLQRAPSEGCLGSHIETSHVNDVIYVFSLAVASCVEL